jgi:DNA polymerase III gamma/tau subunit
MERESAALLAQMADGNMQRALDLDDESLATRREILLGHLAGMNLDRIVTVFNASEELAGNREETLETLDMLLSFFRDMIHLAAGCGDIVNTAIRPALESFTARLGLDRALQLAHDVIETRGAVQRNANVKLALDQLFIKLAAG